MEHAFKEVTQMMGQYRISHALGALCLTELFHALDALALAHATFKLQIGSCFIVSLYSSLTSTSSMLANVMRNWVALSYARMELMNTLLEKSMKNKQLLLAVRGSACELVKKLYRCNDGNFQLLLIETLWRLIIPQRKTEDDRIAAAALAFRVIAHSHTRNILIQQFLKISIEKFDDTLRLFMMRFNDLRPNMSTTRSRLVYSFLALEVIIHGKKFSPTSKRIWIDIGSFALTARLPDPDQLSFHYTISIPIGSISVHALHSPQNGNKKTFGKKTQIVSFTVSLDKASSDSAVTHPLLPPDLIDFDTTKDFSMQLTLNFADAEQFVSLIASRRNNGQSNLSTASVLASSMYTSVNASRRASHHGGSIQIENSSLAAYKPRYSTPFYPTTQAEPISTTLEDRARQDLLDDENDAGGIKDWGDIPFVPPVADHGWMHSSVVKDDAKPVQKPKLEGIENSTLDEFLATLDNLDSPNPGSNKSSGSEEKKSKKKSPDPKPTTPKTIGAKAKLSITPQSPSKLVPVHVSVANMSVTSPFRQDPEPAAVEVPMMKTPAQTVSSPKSNAKGGRARKSKSPDNGKTVSPGDGAAAGPQSTNTSPSSETTFGASSPSMPADSPISPTSVVSPATMLSQVSLYPFSPVIVPEILKATSSANAPSPSIVAPSNQINGDNEATLETPIRGGRRGKSKPPPKKILITPPVESTIQDTPSEKPASLKKRKRHSLEPLHSDSVPLQDNETSQNSKIQSPSKSAQVSPNANAVPTTIDSELPEEDESPPPSKRKSQATKSTAKPSHSLVSKPSTNGNLPRPNLNVPKTPKRELISKATMRWDVPKTPSVAPPPTTIDTPASPSAKRLRGDVRDWSDNASEAPLPPVFDDEEEVSPSQVHIQLQDHVSKLLTLIEQESDKIAQLADQRKKKLQTAWSKDLEEMRTMTHNAHEMLDKVFEIAVNRAQDTIDASGVSFEEFNAMSAQYQSFITKIVDATATRLSAL